MTKFEFLVTTESGLNKSFKTRELAEKFAQAVRVTGRCCSITKYEKRS